jgi:hypothetical protein
MSRSTHHKKVGRNWRNRRKVLNRHARRSKRRAERLKLIALMPTRSEAAIEVLADFEEERGRLDRAERLRNAASDL